MSLKGFTALLALLISVGACRADRTDLVPATPPIPEPPTLPGRSGPTPAALSWEEARAAALGRITTDTALWRQLIDGSVRELSTTPIVIVSSYGDSTPATEGRPLPEAVAIRFAGLYGDSAYLSDGRAVFLRGLYRFPGAVGVVLRVPSMYDPSALVLWVVHTTDLHVDPPVMIADHWGDAGATTDDRASLREGRSGPELTLTRCWYEYGLEETASKESLSIHADSVKVARWVGDSFASGPWLPATPARLEGTGLTSCVAIANEP